MKKTETLSDLFEFKTEVNVYTAKCICGIEIEPHLNCNNMMWLNCEQKKSGRFYYLGCSKECLGLSKKKSKVKNKKKLSTQKINEVKENIEQEKKAQRIFEKRFYQAGAPGTGGKRDRFKKK